VEMNPPRSYSFSEPSIRQRTIILRDKAPPRDWCHISKGMAKEVYRDQMDEDPSGMPKYPFMVQWLLGTYDLDDELAKAYMAATTAKMLDGEDERAFGRLLH
jgi:hypothetical protein